MVCGTPVLAFNRSASQESLHPSASRLLEVTGDSVQLLAAGLLLALEEPSRLHWSREGMMAAARDSHALFAPHMQARAMLRALRKIRQSVR